MHDFQLDICNIQYGLRMLVEAFGTEGTTKKAWFTMHCPVADQAQEEPLEDAPYALLCHFENSRLIQNYVAWIEKVICSHDNYSSSSVSPTFLARSVGKSS